MRSYFQVAEYGSLFFTSLCWLVSLSRKLPIQFSLSLPAHAAFRLNLPKENILNSWDIVQISLFLWTLSLHVQAELKASWYIFQKSLNIIYLIYHILGYMLLKQIIRSDQISRSVFSDSLQPHESQHTRPPRPSPTPGVHSDSRPSSQWYFSQLFVLSLQL